MDRNIVLCVALAVNLLSLPSRGAWIEIAHPLNEQVDDAVAPLAGSVDRNAELGSNSIYEPGVAPLAGSVDRNSTFLRLTHEAVPVAPLAGSVDRNCAVWLICLLLVSSLPSRGAWIEIIIRC